MSKYNTSKKKKRGDKIPVTCGHKDSKGTYCKWGGHGAHYYYTPGDKESMKKAKSKAEAQGRAARASGWIGKDKEGSEEVEEKCIGCNSDKITEEIKTIDIWAKAESELIEIKNTLEKLKKNQS